MVEKKDKFFTNTYITGSGRQNYLRADYLEDPLFTSFTFDIDFVTSPLFYTINKYQNVSCSDIDAALKKMHKNMGVEDSGYDILPVLSAAFLDGDKLGFGLQQNVYMDKPLYGAVEYIYMVDKRNGDGSQSDVRYNIGDSANNGGYKSYKLGNSVKDAVSKSDIELAKKRIDQANDQITSCNKIIKSEEEQSKHAAKKTEMDNKKSDCENIKKTVDGKEFTEEGLENKIKELKEIKNKFESFKKEIVDWVNSELLQYQSRATNIYISNYCVIEIFAKDGLPDKKSEEKKDYLTNKYPNFKDNLSGFINDIQALCDEFKNRGFLNGTIVNQTEILKQFRDKLEYFKLCEKGDTTFKGNISVSQIKEVPAWASVDKGKYLLVVSENIIEDAINVGNAYDSLNKLMTYGCDIDLAFDSNFLSVNYDDTLVATYEVALDDVRSQIYGTDEDGNPCDKYNPSPESPYYQYLNAKEIYENDAFSQAENLKSIAESEISNMESMLPKESDSKEIYSNEIIDTNGETFTIPQTFGDSCPQTVLDMLGFIDGMKQMTQDYPYIIQGVTGLDTAYNKHYGIKDPYLGSGDDKITLTCLESLDLRVSSMFNRYFNAVYDRQYRRERVPVNLRRFNCSIYVHDVRNFVKNNSKGQYENRILELTDMYYSVIEFRFYDCEIVPEETGNIFNDISNESPSEMKKTNFTFTYGNCVVNFVPQSEVLRLRLKSVTRKLLNKFDIIKSQGQ